MVTEYEKFIESKKHSVIKCGIDPIFIPDSMFDFQKAIAEKCITFGRYAGFIDTGLGKTIIELVIASNYARYTNKPVLIMTPLAVAFQFIEESKKFNIDDVSYSKDGKYKTKIVICNYERLHYFNPSDFDCVIADESSILKNFEGSTKEAITAFLKKVKYRYLFTATPSPNDYIELGTSSEAIGKLGYIDMLQKFFKNNNNNTVKISEVDKARAGCEWYLKPHAEKSFWEWVSSWSISVRTPSDLGYSNDRYVLPELIQNVSVVNNQSPLDIDGQMQLFNFPASSFREIKAEVKATITNRCEKAVDVAKKHDISVYWVNRNDESSLIKKLDSDSVELIGTMDTDQKEEILYSFSKQEIKKLITKTSITAFGLNWQHCNHTVYFPDYSYERFYQAIRRFWRFGQKKSVIADIVISDGQTKILDVIMVKKSKAEKMFQNLVSCTNAIDVKMNNSFNKQIKLPSFLGV